jgi:hypothetical protein
MPAPVVRSPEETALNAKGLCGCGCGSALPMVRQYDYSLGRSVEVPAGNAVYFSVACKQRAYRRRQAAGAVVSAEARRLIKLREEAAALELQAKEFDRQAAYAARRAGEVRAEAARKLAEADGQLRIPGTGPARKPRAEARA